ncbi:2-oxo acid dehydrogenase subunit E2 [Arthrobacter sp. Sa2BUA2]|uniref:Dihydrolipoamide acetyltransferase component of pyruvate dehydrogenase complex n=1 Tax=Arthrobacter pullicola TaxID=2762224 RepID=A0ABR8YFG9_9MICC|nr:dihydrolipoamide acetyltransferase family protein [Arthrobacter pullicola]MBD8042958.1 2-oxo acid dehydrogenase subunit E2 [Arthrobacter pullicola]
MIREFRLPDLGEGLTESEILSWRVAEGQAVALNQVIAEVETAKAVVELPSPFAGVVARLHELPGTVVEVGSTIISFDIPDPEEPAAKAPRRQPTLVGYGAEPESAGRPARKPRPGLVKVQPDSAVQPALAVQPASAVQPLLERPRSTPPVRKLARDLGIDLALVTGTGPDGRILRSDVEAAVQRVSSTDSTERPAAPGQAVVEDAPHLGQAREERIPVSGIRKHTAAAMVSSAFTAPHATVFLTLDVTGSMNLLTKLKSRREFDGVRLTPLVLAAKAVCLALQRHPGLNARWDGEAREIIRYRYVNLGIAAATPRGLLVPNIKDAQDLGLRELALAISDLVGTARDGRTPPAALSGGTVSISNVGVFGVDAGTPILNPGEAAILALGAVRSQPWEYEGGIALRQVTTLSLSFDHRLVDGAEASLFLRDIADVLAEPAMVLAMT